MSRNHFGSYHPDSNVVKGNYILSKIIETNSAQAKKIRPKSVKRQPSPPRGSVTQKSNNEVTFSKSKISQANSKLDSKIGSGYNN